MFDLAILGINRLENPVHRARLYLHLVNKLQNLPDDFPYQEAVDKIFTSGYRVNRLDVTSFEGLSINPDSGEFRYTLSNGTCFVVVFDQEGNISRLSQKDLEMEEDMEDEPVREFIFEGHEYYAIFLEALTVNRIKMTKVKELEYYIRKGRKILVVVFKMGTQMEIDVTDAIDSGKEVI